MPLPSRALAALTEQRRPVLRRTAAVAAERWLGPQTDVTGVLDFVERQHGRMNEALALGTNALTTLFQAEVVGRARVPFADADPAVIAATLHRWSGSRIGRLRDFVRFVDSLVAYAALALDAGEQPDAVEPPALAGARP